MYMIFILYMLNINVGWLYSVYIKDLGQSTREELSERSSGLRVLGFHTHQQMWD